jgi:uncharacterized protein (DUF1499 family)
MLRAVTIAALAAAALATACLVLSGPGTRLGLWPFPVGLLLFALSGIVGFLAAAIGAIAWKRGRTPRQRRASAIAAFVGIAVLLLPAYGVMKARRVPPIHDVSTDLEDPPKFSAVLAARGGNSNRIHDPFDPKVARQQRVSYPDLQPVILALTPDDAFARVLETAEKSGWKIVAADRTQRVLEATDTTPFFGFRDDVSVRVRAADRGSRIDVRSTSRVGGSDVGANATRIRKYLEALQQD